MDWPTFTVEISKAWAWPVAVLILARMLRNPIGQLIPLLRTFKGGGITLEFERRLIETKALANNIKERAPGEKELANERIQDDDLLNRASAVGIIMDSWSRVEEAAFNLLKSKTGIEAVKSPMISVLVQREGLLSAEDVAIYEQLRTMRNLVAHSRRVEISVLEAMDYREIAQQIIQRLKPSNQQ